MRGIRHTRPMTLRFWLELALLSTASLTPGAAMAAERILVSPSEVDAQVRAMERDIRAGKDFIWRPLLQAGDAVAALEYWTKPRPPAIHLHEAEYVTVVAGAGTLVYGGAMSDGRETHPGLVEGSRIDGGSTRKLHRGDVFLIPAGVPHWFGITGKRLVLLGTKIPDGKK